MKSFLKKLDWLELVSFCYLWIPIGIFISTWIKLPIALISIASLLISFFIIIKRNLIKGELCKFSLSKEFCFFLLLTIAITFYICFLSGIGGHFGQKSDWMKHNAILQSMIQSKWPVRFNYNGENGILCYYIGYYILPALMGKAFGFDASATFMLFQTVMGIVLSTLMLYRHFNCQKPYLLLFILITIFSFSTFSQSITALYRFIAPDDAWDAIHFLSKSNIVQYSSILTSLCWVTPQLVPTMIAVSLILENRNKYSVWIFIGLPLILFSTFTFVGFVVILLVTWCFDIFSGNVKNIVKETFKTELYYTIVGGGVLVLYICANVLQQKPASADMGLLFLKWIGLKKISGLILFEFAWFLWDIILGKDFILRHRLIFSSTMLLAVLPFFKMGWANDLCMRSSIPALLFICYGVCKVLVVSLEKEELRYAKMLVLFILIAGVPNLFFELTTNIQKCKNHDFKRNYFLADENYLFNDERLRFQYSVWEPNKITAFIVKGNEK